MGLSHVALCRIPKAVRKCSERVNSQRYQHYVIACTDFLEKIFRADRGLSESPDGCWAEPALGSLPDVQTMISLFQDPLNGTLEGDQDWQIVAVLQKQQAQLALLLGANAD